MNKDIRIATAFKSHRKRKRLTRALGFGAEVYLIDLWLTVAMDCPDGNLVGWDDEDIADACGWDKDPEELVTALINCNWLEKNSDGEYFIHDWCEHQGWACKAQERSESAKKAAESRWKKRNKTKDVDESHAESNADSCGAHAERNAPSPNPLPSPLPKEEPLSEQSPDHKKENKFKEGCIELKMSTYLLNHILKRKPDFKKPDLQKWSVNIGRMINLDNRDPNRIKSVIEFCQNDEFWQNNILSTSKLREKFDTLDLKSNSKPQTQNMGFNTPFVPKG